MEHAAHTGHSPSGETDSSPTVGSYNINFQVAGAPMAGAECELSFMVTEQRIGEPLEAFELLHDRLMHLIIVDETLSYFEHVHPAFTDGAFRITHAFPTAGRYKLWAEAKPQGAGPVLAAFRLNVGSGQAGPESRTESTPSAGYRVSLTPSSAPPRQSVELTFDVADLNGKAVTDLELLMAAGGHCVIISADLRDFLHVHPIQDVDEKWRGGPQVKFLTSFQKPGSYQVWGQFQHRGTLITAGFALDVHETHRH